MHLEFLLEEPSAEKVLRNILPSIVTGNHTFKCIVFQGKYDLLKKLPARLRAYKRWIPENYRIIVLVDRDQENCTELKSKLNRFAAESGLLCRSTASGAFFQVLNRIAVEEIEAWFFGDPEAIRLAFPKIAVFENKAQYRNPDDIVNTWEMLEKLLQQKGYHRTGLRKGDAANAISVHMQPLKNKSKSFQVFWDGVSACLKS